MPYISTPFTGDLTSEHIMRHADSEFEKISQASSETTTLELRPIFAEPAKPRDGMIVYADGTTWNPGEGEGPYSYVDGAWMKLSSSSSLAGTYLELYVRTDGNDGNTGLGDNSSGAFLTIQAAVDRVRLYMNGGDIRINVRAGTYASGALVNFPAGNARLFIEGDLTTPSNVVISSSDSCFTVMNPGSILWIGGFKLTSGSAHCLYTDVGGELFVYGKMEYGAAAGVHIVAASLSKIWLYEDYTISGSAGYHFYATRQSSIETSTITITGVGAQAFAYFAVMELLSFLAVYVATFSGTGAFTGPKYYVTVNSAIYAAGGVLPGSIAGSTALGGIYV